MNYFHSSLAAVGSLALSLSLSGQTEVLHDWQFNDAPGTAVFVDVVDAGTQAGSASFDWLGTTTDGEGNWHVTNTAENKYYGYNIHSSGNPVTADKLVVEWAYSSWDWSQTAQKSPNIGFGFVGTDGNGAVTILRNGTSMRTKDTIGGGIVNFGSSSWDSQNIPEARVPVDQASGTELPGAPALDAGNTLKFRYIVDFTGATPVYTADYAVNSSDWYTLYTGDWTAGAISQIRMQAANPDEVCSVKVDYITLTGENVILPQPVGSIWDGVYDDLGDGTRLTGIGLINDANWPWVYHFNTAGWLYILDGSTLESIYGYSPDEEGGVWFWTADDAGWYYSLSDPSQGTMGWARTW